MVVLGCHRRDSWLPKRSEALAERAGGITDGLFGVGRLVYQSLKGLLVLEVLVVPSRLFLAVLVQKMMLQLIYALDKRGSKLVVTISLGAQVPHKARRELSQALFPS